LLALSQASLNRLFELVRWGQENGELRSGNKSEMTKAIWAMVHGVATLSIAYQTVILLPEKNSVEDVATALVNHLLDGLAT
jgi:hypothetical protein